jgi:hypothetical protein
MKLTLIIGLTFLLFGCGQSDKTNSEPIVYTDKSKTADNNNQFIYDFMQIVIADQKLDLSNGLQIDAETSCNLSDDSTFLQTLLIDTVKTVTQKTEKRSSKQNQPTGDTNLSVTKLKLSPLPSYTFVPIVYSPGLSKCLTKADIRSMLNQKINFSDFKWDNNRLGFDTTNHKFWYSFSVPLFSKDSTVAIMLIEHLCPGLCGNGSTILFKKENNTWTSTNGGQWIH